MDPLFEYAHHWLRGTAVRLYRPFDLALNRRLVRDVEAGRPGFAVQLRLVALDALRSEDRDLVHKGIAALAVVGSPVDCVRLESVSVEHAIAVRTAIFEIEHAAPAS
jgi:hypothetical protein